jgi:hypothetical protein
MRGVYIILLVSLLAMLIGSGGVDPNGFPSRPDGPIQLQFLIAQSVTKLATATLFGNTSLLWINTAALTLAVMFLLRLLYRRK